MSRPRLSSKLKARIAPDLKAALKGGETATDPFAVVYQLRGPAGQAVPAAEGMEDLVARVLGKAAKAAKIEPQRQNIFRHLGSFVVMGDAGLHRELIKQPEVCAAVLNRSPRGEAASSSMGRNKRGMATPE